MWTGGVRVIIIDENDKILMVKQNMPERDIWLIPGGGIEDGETSKQAAAREALEETGLEVEVGPMIHHVEQIKGDGSQRFVGYYIAKITGGRLTLGQDPEYDTEHQTLADIRFMTASEIKGLDNLYPEFLKEEADEIIKNKDRIKDPYMIRKNTK